MHVDASLIALGVVSTMIFHQGSMPRAAKGESEDRRKPPKWLGPEGGI